MGMQHIAWMTFVFTLLLGLRVYVFNPIDSSARDQAQQAVINKKIIEYTLNTDKNQRLRHIAGIQLALEQQKQEEDNKAID